MAQEDEGSDPCLPSKQPVYILSVSFKIKKRTIFLKILKTHCDKCKGNTIIKEGDDFVL